MFGSIALFYGRGLENVFSVRVTLDETIQELRRKVLEEIKQDVSTSNLILYAPKSAISAASETTFNEAFARLHLDTEEGQN